MNSKISIITKRKKNKARLFIAMLCSVSTITLYSGCSSLLDTIGSLSSAKNNKATLIDKPNAENKALDDEAKNMDTDANKKEEAKEGVKEKAQKVAYSNEKDLLEEFNTSLTQFNHENVEKALEELENEFGLDDE